MPRKKQLNTSSGVEQCIEVLESFREVASSMKCSRDFVVGECIERLQLLLLVGTEPPEPTEPSPPETVAESTPDAANAG